MANPLMARRRSNPLDVLFVELLGDSPDGLLGSDPPCFVLHRTRSRYCIVVDDPVA
jgi:hypothetical protein